MLIDCCPSLPRGYKWIEVTELDLNEVDFFYVLRETETDDLHYFQMVEE